MNKFAKIDIYTKKVEELTVPDDMKIQDFSIYFDYLRNEIYLAGGVNL